MRTVGEAFYIEEDSPAGETFNEPSKSNRAKLNQRLRQMHSKIPPKGSTKTDVDEILADARNDVAPERVLSSEAARAQVKFSAPRDYSYGEDVHGEKTELQRRTFNRDHRGGSESLPEFLDFVANDEENMKRMKSQFISEDNIRKNKWAKLNQRLGRLILGKQRTAVMSKNVSNIINSFKESGVSYKGIDGIWDAVEKRVLNANDEPDRERLWDTFGRRGMGFNSVTDTRGGPNDDLKLIADQLTKIEESGGNPALGFDSSYGGSLEAVDVTYGTVPEALSKLSPQQESIGYLDEDGKFTIEYNDRYLGKK